MMRLKAVFDSKPLAWLRAASLSYMLGYAFFVLAVGGVLELVLPALSHPLGRLHVSLPLLLFACWAIARSPEVAAHVTAAFTHPRRGATALHGSRSSALVAAFRLDHALRRGFLAWLCRGMPPARPSGQAFSYLEQGSSSTLIAILLLACLVELPVDAMIVSLFVHDPATRNLIHLVCALAGAYSIVCVLGYRWMVRCSDHVLTDDCFDMRIGELSGCMVPLAAIELCEVLAETQQQWCARHGIDRRATALVTPVDRPNVVVRLHTGAAIDALQWGRQVKDVRAVFLYVDRPGALAAAIVSKRCVA